MKSFLIIVIFALSITFLSACAVQKETSCPLTGQYNITGTIVYQDLEGGFYGIVSADGKQYDPVNLPVQFKVDGLTVHVVADPLPAANGIHMWGELIHIIDISATAIQDSD